MKWDFNSNLNVSIFVRTCSNRFHTTARSFRSKKSIFGSVSRRSFSPKKLFHKNIFHQRKCLLDNFDQKWQVRIEKVQFHVKMIVRKLFIFDSKMCNLDSEFYFYSKIIIFVNNLDKRRHFWLIKLFFTRAKSAKKTIFRWKRSFSSLKSVILNKNSHFPRFWVVVK